MSYLTASAISVEFSLGKKFSAVPFRGKKHREAKTFSALNDINIHLKDGHKLGIIGANGAGKTTLLRVLSGILPPSHGSISSQGKLQSVITATTGLIQAANCTDNIKLRGLSYKLSGSELEAYIERVSIDSGLEDFLTLPLKSLSSGMRSRLVMTMFLAHQPEILIMDEWIGVADRMQFSSKNNTSNVLNNCKILVLATHRHQLIEKYCNRCLVLDKGKQQFLGDVPDAFKYYEQAAESTTK